MQSRTLPPGMLGAAFVVWGWQTEHWLLAAILIVLYEFSWLFQRRLQFSLTDVYRLVDFTTLIFVALSVYVGFTFPAATAVFEVTQWLPVVLFPLLALQKYSDYTTIPVTALSMHLRKRGERHKTIDLSYAFFILSLIAASTGNQHPDIFYVVLFCLWAWFFWFIRNAHFHGLLWLVLLPALFFGGYALNGQIRVWQRYAEHNLSSWYYNFFKSRPDPYHRTTALGFIGELKTFENIILRVKAQGKPPTLLRNASYNRFTGDFWSAREKLGFKSIPLADPKQVPKTLAKIEILMDFENNTGILPLPLGTQAIWDLATEYIGRNPLGAVKIKRGPDVAMFDVAYDPNSETDFPPLADDLDIPLFYRQTIKTFTEQNSLVDLPPQDALKAIDTLFFKDFNYSLNIDNGRDALPLIDFLTRTKQGHCEYFATATVLLLRQIGIPARYASGYGVQEYSPEEDFYLVRQKHAHAWALAYVDGRWRDVDTTPPDWSVLDGDHTTLFSKLHDLWTRLWSAIDQWRIDETQTTTSYWLLLLLIPLFWMLYTRFRKVRVAKVRNVSPTTETQPIDHIVAVLRAQQLLRRPGETISHYFTRAQLLPNLIEKERLQDIVDAYYRYRFFDQDQTSSKYKTYLDGVNRWLEKQ